MCACVHVCVCVYLCLLNIITCDQLILKNSSKSHEIRCVLINDSFNYLFVCISRIFATT